MFQRDLYEVALHNQYPFWWIDMLGDDLRNFFTRSKYTSKENGETNLDDPTALPKEIKSKVEENSVSLQNVLFNKAHLSLYGYSSGQLSVVTHLKWRKAINHNQS